MRTSVTIAAFWASAAAAFSVKDINKGILPGAYIVEFVPGQHSADDFYKNLTSNGIDAVHRQTFQTNVFPGTSFHLPTDSKEHLDIIDSFGQVKV
jgi:hypothetical protein